MLQPLMEASEFAESNLYYEDPGYSSSLHVKFNRHIIENAPVEFPSALAMFIPNHIVRLF